MGVEVVSLGREHIGFDVKQFQPVADAIEGVVQMIAVPIQKVKPKQATVKVGIELTIIRRIGYDNESGQLTVVIVKGSGTGNLEMTLE